MIKTGIVKAGIIKVGLISGITGSVSRYFRRNEGTTDYISHSSVTVDRIVMLVFPDANNAGLPTGAPVVTADVFQTIDFAHSGTISEIGKNGASFFGGIIANAEYYNLGVLIHAWDINDNSNTVLDRIGSNNGTVINGNADDWGLFQQQNGGDWLGPNLVINGGFDTDTGWSKATGWSISGGTANCDGTQSGDSFLFQPISFDSGSTYSVSYSVLDYVAGGINPRLGGSNPGTTRTANGDYVDELVFAGGPTFNMIANSTFEGSIDNVFVKELLKVT